MKRKSEVYYTNHIDTCPPTDSDPMGSIISAETMAEM